ncbi:hypothetical protein CFC21_099781 [Triticum aestivum]|uniref:Chitin-binding type-1 domain-containing protein n=2 Tax=Triticum aestivum TaxID=4565 RepID=A0A3B6RMB9_WHEAT|nr:hypothetical protein CFC21_099781 [Triticum aestivum]
MECPNNLCCSKDGYCGLGFDYCSAAAGCQSGACYNNKIWGAQAGGAFKYGYCGLGPEFCGAGCQNGACSTDKPCGNQANGARCTNNYCCSQYGSCGLGKDYCGTNCQSGACYNDSILANILKCVP